MCVSDWFGGGKKSSTVVDSVENICEHKCAFNFTFSMLHTKYHMSSGV